MLENRDRAESRVRLAKSTYHSTPLTSDECILFPSPVCTVLPSAMPFREDYLAQGSQIHSQQTLRLS